MAEYIERSVGVSILRAKANMAVLMDAAPYFEKAAQMLEKLPAADVVPVVHGRWNVIEGRRLDNAICSNCGRRFQAYYEAYSFCPNCGAKMDGGDSNEAD